MAIDKPDLCIIGAGPGGLALARQARVRGASVIVVESGTAGGMAHDGALPVHALGETARRVHQIRAMRNFGVGVDAPRINFSRVAARIRDVRERAATEDSAQHLSAIGIEIITDTARFSDRRTVVAGARTIRAKRFVIATGARPAIPDVPGLPGVPFLTPETVFEQTRRPSHLIVIGAGASGLMLAQAHLRLGCAVTAIDTHAPLGELDRELADIVLAGLRAEGLEVLSDTGVVAVGGDENRITVAIKTGADEREIAGSHLLVATGKTIDATGLGLDAAGVRLEGGRIVLTPGLRTSNRRIYCIGDATGGYRSVQAARYQAGLVLERTLGLVRPGRSAGQPIKLVHTDPPVATVGYDERAAQRRHGANYFILRQPLSELVLARARGDTGGMVRLIVHRSGRILGAGIVGHGAADLAALFSLAVERGLTLEQMGNAVPPHPTYAECVAALAQTWAFERPPADWGRRILALRRLLP